MPTLDYISFPHIFDAVVDQLIATEDDASLRAIYYTSHLSRHIVYEKIGQHLALDFRVKPVAGSPNIGPLWFTQHEVSKLLRKVLDIYAIPEVCTYPISFKLRSMADAACPDVVRLMDHYYNEDALSFMKPIETVVFHTQNWVSPRSGNPPQDFWIPLLPLTARRIVINIRAVPRSASPSPSSTAHSTIPRHSKRSAFWCRTTARLL